MKSLAEIDEEAVSSAKKVQKKRALIREQLNVRKKLLREKIQLPFTCKGKQQDIIEEFVSTYKDKAAPETLTLLHQAIPQIH